MKKLPIILLVLSPVFINDEVKAGNAYIQTLPLRFDHARYGSIHFQKLKKLYHFDELLAREKSEYRQMISLKNQVYKRLTYSFRPPFPNARNSLFILREAARGKTFLCNSYAALYMQCALSMGWTARYIFLRRPDGLQHAAVDIWSNQHRKWIYIDPTWNIHVEKDHRPLSLHELRSEWLSDKGRKLACIFGAGKNQKVYRYSDFPVTRSDSAVYKRLPLDVSWLSYSWQYAIIGRNNFFTHSDGTGRNIWDRIYIYRDRHNRRDTKWPFRRRKSLPLQSLFGELNIPVVTKRILIAGGAVRIHLSPHGPVSFTPGFDYFEVLWRDRWERIGSSVDVSKSRLIRGLAVRIVNRCRVTGPVVFLRNAKSE